MGLTVKGIEGAKAKEKLYRLSDGNGLYLEVPPKGAKRWRYRYRHGGKEKMLSLGTYPTVTLKEAREKRDEENRTLSRGINPAEARKEERILSEGLNSFETVAREWHDKFKAGWSVSHAKRIMAKLENDVFPWIGKFQIHEVTAPDVLELLHRIEERGALETAHRTRGIIGQVFRFAVSTTKAPHDPTAALKGALPSPPNNHLPAITKPKEIAALLRDLDGYKGQFVTRCALRLAPLVFVRPGELRRAEWPEIDFDAAEWRIPAEKMKARRPHVVPLSIQAQAILKELHPLTGSGRYVFPGIRTPERPMSENTINAALRKLGYEKDVMTCHGFRSMASTNLNEQGWNRDAIERQLAHVEGNAVRAAYNHADYLEERREMMQAWADYLDGLKGGAKVIPIRQQAG